MERLRSRVEQFRPYLLPAALSIGALLLAAVHVAAPQLRIDSITLVLLAAAVVPWLGGVFKSIQTPGGWGFEFQEFRREVRQQLSQVSERVEAVEQIVFSGDIDPAQVRGLREQLARFHQYLQSRGLKLDGPPPAVNVDAQTENASYYEPDRHRITIARNMAADPSVILREYCHRALLAAASDSDELLSRTYDLESGIAFYLPSSFLDEPRYGARAAAAIGLQQPYIVDLENDGPLPPRTRTINPENRARAEAWAGVCWELRTLLGKEAADRLVVSCWQRVASGRLDRNPEAAFAALLVDLLPGDAPAGSAAAVRALLQRRKVPMARVTGP